MRINLLGKQSAASAILVAAVNGIILWLKRYGVQVTENELYQLYYEVDRFIERSKINKLAEKIDEEQFYKFIDEFVNVVDVELTKNPKFLENKIILWKLFAACQDLLNKKWVRNSPVTNEIKYQINKKIIETPELLDYKVKRDVDMAISDYNKEVKKLGLDPPENKP
ncbi:MAG: hypothetical protein ACO242_06125, partial [Candidatus Fonsibacter ubiquis]